MDLDPPLLLILDLSLEKSGIVMAEQVIGAFFMRCWFVEILLGVFVCYSLGLVRGRDLFQLFGIKILACEDVTEGAGQDLDAARRDEGGDDQRCSHGLQHYQGTTLDTSL